MLYTVLDTRGQKVRNVEVSVNVSLERSLFEIAGQHFSKCMEESSVPAAVSQKVLIQQTHRK